MSDTWQETGGTRTWDFASQIDEVCDLFEAACKRGARPQIEDYLNDTPVPARAALLRELIPLDMEYRKRAGETVTEDDYRARFPSWTPGDFTLGPSSVPLTAGRYQLGDKIGEGGMGEVFRVLDPDFNRSLAVKVLLERHRGRPELEVRFLEEAQILGQLQHPGIVPVHELGRLADGRPFFTMKLVKGQTLAELLAEHERAEEFSNPLEAAAPGWKPASQNRQRLLAIFEQVCQTLAHAHSRGVIHRDLKPSNIMVGAFGEVQVMDWGLAKVLADPPSRKHQPAEQSGSVVQTVRTTEPAQATQPGSILGTYAYMPPEQARGEIDRLDERSDVFGLGAILCEILTAQPPYTGPTREDLFRQALGCDLADAEARLAQCGSDGELVELTRKSLSREREQRPRDAWAVAQAVTAYRTSVQERLRAAELAAARATAKAAEERKRTRLAVGLAAAVVLFLWLGGGGLVWWLRQQELERHDVEPLLANAEEILRHPDKDLRLAEQSLDQATARMAGGGPADLQKRLGARRRDLDMAKRLETASLRAMGTADVSLDFLGGDRDFAAVFAQFGLDPLGTGRQEVADAIRDSPIAKRLITALDFWALCKDKIGPKSGADLRSLANSVDHNDHRRRLRSMVPSDLAEFEDRVRQGGSGASPTNVTLVDVLVMRPNVSAAESGLRKANVHHPEHFSINNGVAAILLHKGNRDDSQTLLFLQAVLILQPDSPFVYYARASFWAERKDYDRAIRDYDEAIRLDPTYAKAYNARGHAWAGKNDYDRAIRDYDESIRLDPGNPANSEALNDRGIAYASLKRFATAEADFRVAVHLSPGYVEAWANLGGALSHQAQFIEAGNVWGAGLRQPPSGEVDPALQRAMLHSFQINEQLIEHLARARVCQECKQYAAAQRLYASAFVMQPAAQDVTTGYRYKASCCAAMAGCAQGNDADKLYDKERSRLRNQALEWLRADLVYWSKQAESEKPSHRQMVRNTLNHWKHNADLAGVRDHAALTKLPADEQAAFKNLWSDVAVVLKKAQEKP
jgi:serine/threonine-protein kinase